MDLRKKRTKKSIAEAFLRLREKKPLEKITVRELSEMAFINKATFYTHYKDIYDLSDTLENECLQSILEAIPHPEYLLTNPREGVRELTRAFFPRRETTNILFSDSRAVLFVEKIEVLLKKKIYQQNPELSYSLELDILMTVLIQGCFRAFIANDGENENDVTEIIANINECLIKNYKYITK